MSMLEQTKQFLDKKQAFSGRPNLLLEAIVQTINFPTVNDRMKSVVAVAQITSFASQFKRNIDLWDGVTEVPINAISFIITNSGSGKDSSVKAARNCFKKGYKLINEYAYEKAVDEAREAAAADGNTRFMDEAIYSSYMKPIPPIDIMPTTSAGLVQHINDIAALGVTSPLLYAGEFSDELAYNQDMVDNIKILSETYDTGDKEVKYTKAAEHRSEAIKGQSVSALFVGSPGYILYDDAVKKKFNIAFMSKLARRSWFCYAPDKLQEKDFDDIDSFLAFEQANEDGSQEIREQINIESYEIAEEQLKKVGQNITVSKEVEQLFRVYKRYNNDYADMLPNQESTYVLIRRHLQWKALKLSGAFAILKGLDSIDENSYIEAIRFCETLDKDMEAFERDLNKSAHELLVDYFKTKTLTDGAAKISTHELKKQAFMTSVTRNKLTEMTALCAGCDNNSVYSVVDDFTAIQYEPVIKTDTVNLSYKSIDCRRLNKALKSGSKDDVSAAKQHIGSTAACGYKTVETTFEQLSDLFKDNYAFAPFKFKDGIRDKDKIDSGTKWLVFDVDDSALTAEETHMMIYKYNHHISLTSDNTNPYKFRVLLELDSEVQIDSVTWKYFYTKIAEELAIKIDVLPQFQIYYSYAGRTTYSNTEGEPVPTRDYLMYAKEAVLDKKATQPVYSTPQKKAQLKDPLVTFNYAFEADYGKGSISMYRAMLHAQDLGATEEECLDLLEQINHYWESPMQPKRFEKLQEQTINLFRK